jgi:hypothetical protein
MCEEERPRVFNLLAVSLLIVEAEFFFDVILNKDKL